MPARSPGHSEENEETKSEQYNNTWYEVSKTRMIRMNNYKEEQSTMTTKMGI